ncbi:MAG TPA: epoxide hydrolase [Chitinophagaceae bacterium]|nr:epoxide hydrolase [Chitinophagaceae bacterium]
MNIQNFTVNFAEDRMADLALRLKMSRWPTGKDNVHWQYGVNKKFLANLVDYWIEEFDWRKQVTALNEYPQFTFKADKVELHYYHVKSKEKNAIPLLLCHGWPDSFLRYQKAIPLLADPGRFGGDSADSFDLIIPSLPGFGFSKMAEGEGMNNAAMAAVLVHLMTDVLGYKKFAAAGGDIGSGVTRQLAYNYPKSLLAIHLTDVGIIRELIQASNSETLSPEAHRYGKAAQEWLAKEGAYIAIQSTKPLTLAYGLSDSPIGLAAWLLEKFHAWSDCGGDLNNSFSNDELLTNIMIYWLSNCIGSANQAYYENVHSLPAIGRIEVPTGLALFAKDVLPPPKDWVIKNFNLMHWSQIKKGGHFTAMECPELFVSDIRNFLRPFRKPA